MLKLKGIATLCIAVLLSTALWAQEEDAARVAAGEWLLLLDGGDHAATWQSAAGMFQSALSVEAWTQAATGVRAPLGGVQSRSEKALTLANSLPGVPEGRYAVLQFDTAFANKGTAVETLTLALDGEQWKVAGYFVR